MARTGVLAGGNWIIDRVNIIDRYPEEDGLACVLDRSTSNGGSPYNLLKDLAKLKATFPLGAVGVLGEDDAGDFILADCRGHGIDTTHLRRTAGADTSSTEVMTVRSTGRRTFFHRVGANRLLEADDFPIASSNARILHVAYLLLLEGLDQIGADGRTGAARLFEQARSLGIRTSADVVSSDSDQFAAVVDPSLPALDYFFLNEAEAEKLTGIPTRRGDDLDWEAVSRAARELVDRGVKELACVHSPEGALALTGAGREIRQASVKLPRAQVAGAAGAGDALAAGVLFGLHDGWQLEDCLRLGVCAAAASLQHVGCSEGVLPAAECLRLGESLGFGH